jgi:hypothetical protein
MRCHVLALGVLLLGACAARTHLSANYGRATHEARIRQAANPQAGERAATRGLDPQEAAVVAQGYRKSLAPKGESSAPQEQMLIVAPSARAGRQGDYMPAASVPNER